MGSDESTKLTSSSADFMRSGNRPTRITVDRIQGVKYVTKIPEIEISGLSRIPVW
jgi:hypothetical protein